MDKKNKSNREILFVSKYLHPLALLIIVAVMAYLMYFLYQKVYKTIISAEEIAVLQQKTTINGIDLQNFSQILQKLKDKATASTTIDNSFAQVNNPFSSEIASSTKK